MNAPRAVVIGAGIGGLTAAAALHRHGWSVTVLERSPALGAVGAGIGLAPNAVRALDTIGVGDDVRALSRWQNEGGLRRPDGRWVTRTTSDAFAERFGGPLVVVHRATLVDLLVSRLPAGAVRTAAPAALADPGGPGRPARVTVGAGLDAENGEVRVRTQQFAAVEEIEADLVVGADGIHSAVRRTLFPQHPGPRYTGLTAWRVVVPAPDIPFAPHETWGRGAVWGTSPLHNGRIYAYGCAIAPAGGTSPDGERAELLRRFGTWHQPIPAVLAAAGAAGSGPVLRHDLYETAQALPAFHRGRVALLGDAVHAMAPMLGQGGCQAIEDGVVLAAHLGRPATADSGDITPALAAYSAERLPRTMDVVRRSGRMCRAVALSSRPAVALRTAVIGVLGRFAPHVALRSFDGIADWQPPSPTYAAGTGAAAEEAKPPRGTRP
ncbi:FAD-dependent monooxygenase [Streptomyces sp. NPDC048639]|uniref:FAD-dependent monooxygenase n=1 Tax=Streptomyces sp. NPDC048639 TaxID=3365581 RepID=UPI00372414C4